jgi:hypothetical protein
MGRGGGGAIRESPGRDLGGQQGDPRGFREERRKACDFRRGEGLFGFLRDQQVFPENAFSKASGGERIIPGNDARMLTGWVPYDKVGPVEAFHFFLKERYERNTSIPPVA